MNEKRYTVTGMNCGHCVATITGELTEVPGVSDVDVDLASGAVLVRGAAMDDVRLRAAITEAGYGIASQ